LAAEAASGSIAVAMSDSGEWKPRCPALTVSRDPVSNSQLGLRGYNIADCEIGQNPVTNTWENDNSG
jgi:hypothetical protein